MLSKSMKKLILTIFLISNLGLMAQKSFQLGFQAFPMSTWMMNKEDSDMSKDTFEYQKTWGMQAGVNLGYSFNNNLGIHANLLYSSQGQNHGSKNKLGEPVRNVLRMYYLKLPILFKWNTDSELKFSYAIEAGPQFSYLAGIKEKNDDKSYEAEHPPMIYYTNVPERINTFKPFQVGAVLRTGLDIKLRFNLKINTRIWVDYAFTDSENKDAKYNVTYQGITTEQSYYSKNRKTNTNLTGGLQVGFTYYFIPKLHY